jgi:hypothetical protein
MDKLKSDVLAVVQLLTPDQLYNLWAAGGFALFVIWCWWSYGWIRRLAGHRKFRGTWYNAAQYEVLIQTIHEDSASGRRVMQADEMAALRLWRFGSAKTFNRHGSGL